MKKKNSVKQLVLTLFILALLCINLFWGMNLKDPHLLVIRDIEYFIFLASILVIFAASSFQNNRKIKITSIICASVLAILVSAKEYQYVKSKDDILSNESNKYLAINKRLIVGFNNKDEVRKLVSNGIAGIFLTKRNIQGESVASLKSFLFELQEIRINSGLEPLIVTTDQEGGPVSRLSPLIERQELLSVAHAKGESAYGYGKKQGEWLKDLGITVNFSPVVDLKPKLPPSKLDFHSLIATRAISSNPLEVLTVALPYVKGLEASGVTATLKHFPGLARVQTDTHHFSASLDIDIQKLVNEDWIPFKGILKSSSSWLMLSHLILKQIDPDNPVSTSSLVVQGLIRSKLGINNILVTDDMTMGATYNRGFCKSVIQSFSTDINYILIAYDYEKYFTAVQCIHSHNKSKHSDSRNAAGI